MSVPATDLLRRPVRARGVRLGRTVDLIVDAERTRVLGFDVLCSDGVHRFLPFPAARIGGDGLEVGSTLTLLEPAERSFYDRHGRSLEREEQELRAARVDAVGTLLTTEPAERDPGRC